MVEEGNLAVNTWSSTFLWKEPGEVLCRNPLYRGILVGEINHLSLGLEELPTWRRVWEERLGLHWVVARSIRCASTKSLIVDFAYRKTADLSVEQVKFPPNMRL